MSVVVAAVAHDELPRDVKDVVDVQTAACALWRADRRDAPTRRDVAAAAVAVRDEHRRVVVAAAVPTRATPTSPAVATVARRQRG